MKKILIFISFISIFLVSSCSIIKDEYVKIDFTTVGKGYNPSDSYNLHAFDNNLVAINSINRYKRYFGENAELNEVNEDLFEDNILLFIILKVSIDGKEIELANLSRKDDELLLEINIGDSGYSEETKYLTTLVTMPKTEFYKVSLSRFEVYSANLDYERDPRFYNYKVITNQSGDKKYIYKPLYRPICPAY